MKREKNNIFSPFHLLIFDLHLFVCFEQGRMGGMEDEEVS